MFTPSSSDAQEPYDVATYLAGPIEALWHAFDEGRVVADDFFAEDDRPYDPHLWAHLARYHASSVLPPDGETEDGWVIGRTRTNSGIKVIRGAWTVMVCKAIDNNPQSPGRNTARRRFYQQLSLFSGGAGGNLILFWRVRDDELELGLCRPRGLWRFKGTPKLAWRVPIVFDPIQGLRFEGPADGEDDDLFRFDRDDETGEEGESPG